MIQKPKKNCKLWPAWTPEEDMRLTLNYERFTAADLAALWGTRTAQAIRGRAGILRLSKEKPSKRAMAMPPRPMKPLPLRKPPVREFAGVAWCEVCGEVLRDTPDGWAYHATVCCQNWLGVA